MQTGVEMVKVIALLKRRPGMTPQQFQLRWLGEHVAISSKLPGLLGYRINIAMQTPLVNDGGEPLYDGTAEMWWADLDSMEAAFASEIGAVAGADADKFAAVRVQLCTDEFVVLPGPMTTATTA